MRKIQFAFAAALAVCAVQAHAATLEVGSGKKYSSIRTASSAANPGDTILVYPGTYSSAKIWDSNLTIKKAPNTSGSVVLSGSTYQDKGLLLITGNNVTVDGLTFNYAKSTSGNGAGIRLEGTGLTVKNSSFYKNQNGMLVTPLNKNVGTVTIDRSTFKYNGSGTGQTHGIYINSVYRLNVTNSTFIGTKVGHHLKSRADVNHVAGNRFDDTSMSKAASYQIEFPNGGTATIENNTLIKGKYSSNSCCSIALGFEMYKGSGYRNPTGPIVVRNNKFTNQRTSTSTFVSNRTGTPATLTGNTFSGPVKALSGAGSVNGVIS